MICPNSADNTGNTDQMKSDFSILLPDLMYTYWEGWRTRASYNVETNIRHFSGLDLGQ